MKSNESKIIAVLPYNTSWVEQFDTQANKIKSALNKSFIAIYHVGSTSVLGLASKPIIDIIAEVQYLSFDHQGLSDLGYEYRGGFNLPLRQCFTLRSDDLNINLHIFEKDDPEIELNLLFRDYLRNNTEAKEEYEQLKYELIKDKSAHQKNNSIYRGYTLGKNDFIQNILQKSGFNRLRFAICTHRSEWNSVKNFRNKYFLKNNNTEDPYIWTFDRKDHKHFVLYKGVEIIGYAHIQITPKETTDLHAMVIDEEHKGKDYNKEFIILIEKWLKLQAYKSMHLDEIAMEENYED